MKKLDPQLGYHTYFTHKQKRRGGNRAHTNKSTVCMEYYNEDSIKPLEAEILNEIKIYNSGRDFLLNVLMYQ